MADHLPTNKERIYWQIKVASTAIENNELAKAKELLKRIVSDLKKDLNK